MAIKAKATGAAAKLIDQRWEENYTAVGAFRLAHHSRLQRFELPNTRPKTSLLPRFKECLEEINVSSLEEKAVRCNAANIPRAGYKTFSGFGAKSASETICRCNDILCEP